jgi:hypothetical protein
MRIDRPARRCAALLLLAVALAGCSVAMSANRSTRRGDVAMLRPGAERTLIEATFGLPNSSHSLEDGKTIAIYLLDPDAHSEGAKAAAIGGHLIMDVLTLGLWEVIGTPLEIAARDQLVSYAVIYGTDHRVEKVDVR